MGDAMTWTAKQITEKRQHAVGVQFISTERLPEEEALFQSLDLVRASMLTDLDSDDRFCVLEQILGASHEYRAAALTYSVYFQDSWDQAGWIAWCHQFGPGFRAGAQTESEALMLLKSRIAAGERPTKWDGYYATATGKVWPGTAPWRFSLAEAME
jgi:hypothetical protein